MTNFKGWDLGFHLKLGFCYLDFVYAYQMADGLLG